MNAVVRISATGVSIGASAAARAAAARMQRRRERAWAWLSALTLVLCWDLCARLDQRVSPPRVRIAHAVEREHKVENAERMLEL